MIQVVVADDHAVVRTGVRAVLASERDLSIVAEAGDAAGAVRASVRVSHVRDALSLEFDDDGRGFPDQASSQSIRERVAGLGGAVDWPEPGRSHLRVRIPLGGAPA